MKGLLFSTLLLLCFVVHGNAQVAAATDPVLTALTEKYAHEVYKDYVVYTGPEYIPVYAEWLSRTEIKTQPFSATENYPLLSSVILKNKYNPALVRDNASNFDPANFNALKYFFEYYSKTEKIYRVDGTGYIILIHPKVK